MRLLYAFFLLFPSCLWGWWDTGHMAVGKIAYDRLKPEVKTEVNRLISLWDDRYPESSDFITACCWADDIRDEFVSLWSWHVSPIPLDPDGILSEKRKRKLLGEFVGRDALFAIDASVKTLRSADSSDWSKAFMLRFLIHCLADLHQPLHCATLYNSHFPHGDRGGNAFLVNWEGQTWKLHLFWDSICGKGIDKWQRPLSGEKQLELFTLAEEIVKSIDEDAVDVRYQPEKWREEGFEAAIVCVYHGIESGCPLSGAYVREGQLLCYQRVALAGVRLAYLLNEIFSK